MDDGIALALLTDDDLILAMGGFAVRVGVAGLLTGVEALLEELPGRVAATVVDDMDEFPGRVDAIVADGIEELAGRFEGIEVEALPGRVDEIVADGPVELAERFAGIVEDRPVGVDGRTLVLVLDEEARTPDDLLGVDGLATGVETGAEGRALTVELGVDERNVALVLEERDLRGAELVELERTAEAFAGCCRSRVPRKIRDVGSALEGGSDLEIPSLDVVFSNDLADAAPLKEYPFPTASWSILGMRGVAGGVKSQS